MADRQDPAAALESERIVETLPLLTIHAEALRAMADGEPEEAARSSVLLAQRLREKATERTHLLAGLEELLDVATRWISGDNKLDPERWYAARDYARKLLADADAS